MKKIFAIVVIIVLASFLKASGYKGTLPDLTIKKTETFQNDTVKNLDILPLDKLTIPVKQPVKTDKVLLEYIDDITDAQRQLERLIEILQNDKSFKNFVFSFGSL